jgi:hypothetical protein
VISTTPSPERVSFVCGACQLDTGSVVPRTPSWAALWGFAGCLRWLAEPPAAGVDALSPLCLAEAPAAGAEQWLAVGKPFHAALDQEVWCLYQPPLSYYTGWEDQPDELARSALVRCKVLGFRDVRARSAIVHVLVTDVLAFAQIGERIPAGDTIGASLLEQIVPSARRQASRLGQFSYLDFNFESDVGTWAIIERRRDREFLIVAGEWGWHEDYLFAGNSPLDAEATQALHRMLDAD